MHKSGSFFYWDLIYLEVLNLYVLPHVFWQHLHDRLLIRTQSDVSFVPLHFLTPQSHVSAL